MNKPKQPLTPDQAFNRAAAICARSEQSLGDMRGKLVKWGLNSRDTNQVLSQLIEQDFINDERYARAFVKDKFAFNGWGRVKIAYQLRQKGIPTEYITDALTAIDEDQYRQRLIELLSTKWRSVKRNDSRAAWAAMMRFAASRGFETTIAAQCVKLVTRLDAEED